MTPRLLTRKDAAAYCSMSVSGFSARVKSGMFPAAMPGTRRWDKAALDAALDRISCIKHDIEVADNDNAEADDYFKRRANAG